MLKKILLKAILPPLIALIICIGFIYAFPNMSETLYIILIVTTFTLSQFFLARD
jgi:hypothetical protein